MYKKIKDEDLFLVEEEGKIVGILFQRPEGEEGETPLLLLAEKEIREYLAGKRKEFTFPIQSKGTDFQKRVWSALLEIPYGKTQSYGEIAEKIQSPKACRAVGGANNKNPLSIVVPCHRVIGKNGSLVGYGGGLDWKKRLLSLEGISWKEEKTCKKTK